MRHIYIGAATAALFALVIAGAAVNFRFGWQMGQATTSFLPGWHDGYIWGSISLALDLLKTGLPVIVAMACMARGQSAGLRTVIVLFCAVLWAPITAYSFNSAFGSALLSRTDSAGARQHQADTGGDLKAERARLLKRDPWQPEIERWRELPSRAIENEMNAHRQSRLWTASGQCAAASTPAEQSYCRTWFLLHTAREAAIQSEADHTRLIEIEAKLATVASVTVADPQARAYASLTGASEETIRSLWAALLAFLLEAVPNIGPALLVMYSRLAAADARAEDRRTKGSSTLIPTAAACTNIPPDALDGAARTMTALTAPVPDPARPVQTRPDPANICDETLDTPARTARKPARRRALDQTTAAGPRSPAERIVAAAARTMGPGEKTLPEICTAVKKLAAARGVPSPHSTAIGAILSRQFGLPSRRGSRTEGRAMVYDLTPAQREACAA